jgi:hypothetical protein
VQGFVDAVGSVYSAAERAPGYISHAIKTQPEQPLFGASFAPIGGEFTVPRFYTGGRTPGTVAIALTMSLWSGILPAQRFVYEGLHKEVLAKRLQWFVRPQWPGYVLWWIGPSHVPTWGEGCERLEYLHDSGPSPRGFTFRTTFEPTTH